MIREIDPRGPAFEYLRMDKGRMKKIIAIVKKSKFDDAFEKVTAFPLLISDHIGKQNYKDLIEIVRDEFGRSYIARRYSPVSLFRVINYFVWASVIYLKGVKNLRDILYELSVAKATLVWTKKTLFGKDYLKYLTEEDEDGKGNYLDIVPVVKILSEYMDLPLKGKSLEEYKKAIIETCKEMIKEEERKQAEKQQKEGKNDH